MQRYPRLDDRIGPGEALDVDITGFDATYENIVGLVNSNEEFKDNLRGIAKDLVRRRRARQAMGGPRWDVFVGKTGKPNKGGWTQRS